jgi:hypothetical protein
MSPRWTDALRAWWPARPRILPQPEHERVLAAAAVEHHGGLSVLHLAGTPYEMGYQHGVLARDLIHGFRQAAYDYVTALVPGPAWLARPLLFYQAAAYWPTIPAELAQEMRGIAHGAGVHPIEVLVSTAIWEMFLVSGCSEFATVGPVTRDGTLLHGYNYDLMHPDHALIQPFLAAMFCRPNGGIPFVTVNTVGSVGANAGMNEAGITVAWDNTYLKDDTLTRDVSLPVVPFIVTLRRLLQYSHSLDQAVELVKASLPRPLGDIILIGSSGEGKAVALETAGSVGAVREMEDGAVWSTNCFRSPQLGPQDCRGDGQGLPESVAQQRFPRYTAYAELFAAHRGRLDPATAAAFLRDPYPREAEGFVHPVQSRRSTISRDITSWSLVMEPEAGRLWISDTRLPGCQGRYFAFDLLAWRRLPQLDLPPTGYHAALRCAERFLEGNHTAAHQALAEAVAIDGSTAPLLLMQAVLQGLADDREGAAQSLASVVARWGHTPPGALARAWLENADNGTQRPLPFPSAIRLLLRLQPAPAWQDRVVSGPH